MSTPMRGAPSQQGRTPSQIPATGSGATPQASTPFSNPQTAAAFSPHGPRSSPQQFKKSPATATSATMVAQHSNAGAPVNFDSPSAAAALGALGMNDLGLDNISVGGLVGGTGRTDEEDRRKKMDYVIDLLWSKDSGRVSNQGLERLAVHLGLECLWEAGPSGNDNDKILIIAGQTMGVEVGITNHIVHHASLTFNESVPSLDKHVNKASAILLKDLALAPGQTILTKKLTQFRANLERLTTLDKLSVPPALNCHEAIAGLWESLDKLHTWDVENLRRDPELSDLPESSLKVYALCNRHGCPLMHTRGRIGLSLDYWKDRHKLASTTVETEEVKTWVKTWGILVECAPASGMVYNPVRLSDKWIGPNVEKSNLTDEEMISSASGPVLDWLEPPNILLPPAEETKAEGGLEPSEPLTRPRPPEVVFEAKFDPPVVVTHAVAMEIYKISGTNPSLSSITFDALLYPIPGGSSYDPSEPREITYTQRVINFVSKNVEADEPNVEMHQNTLFIYKPVYGQTLDRVTFSHPKDLISMLPYLRQYAFLSVLLSHSLELKEWMPSAKKADETNNLNVKTTRDEFSRFMGESDDATPGASKALKVDMVLTAHPIPRLELVFPFRNRTANILLEIQLGGRVHIVSDNIFGDRDPNNKGKGKAIDIKQWAAWLETLEDIGLWIEMIKIKLG
ncbi:mediator of RNA polymerase II transcription subunit 1-domain-containing protein [Xylariomycetidae sp. FL2044]|nr:mediator of RNA polymerase II transcription subunit 1-domain-containing protein [Xylariomycetidae sp. FL2044]